MRAHEIIKKKVLNSGVTLTFISKKTGISINTISNCLNGKRQIKADEFILICNALNITSINTFKSSSKPTH